MIDANKLREFIESNLKEDYFLVDLSVSRDNIIKVEIDSMASVDIDYCIELTRAIEGAFDREEEDYELEVGSAGLTSPFKVRAQYDKNIGNKVEVLTGDGRKLHGTLTEANDAGFTIESMVKVKLEGAKRPVEQLQTEQFSYADVKSVKYELEF